MTRSLLTNQPYLTVLPARVVAGGQLTSTYPGDPRSVGWTIFRVTSSTWLHHEDADLFKVERDAQKLLFERYGIAIDLTKSSAPVLR